MTAQYVMVTKDGSICISYLPQHEGAPSMYRNWYHGNADCECSHRGELGGKQTQQQTGQSSTNHSDMVEVVDEEDSAQLLGLEGAGQLHEQVHAGVPHPVQVVVQLPILQPSGSILM